METKGKKIVSSTISKRLRLLSTNKHFPLNGCAYFFHSTRWAFKIFSSFFGYTFVQLAIGWIQFKLRAREREEASEKEVEKWDESCSGIEERIPKGQTKRCLLSVCFVVVWLLLLNVTRRDKLMNMAWIKEATEKIDWTVNHWTVVKHFSIVLCSLCLAWILC